MSCLSGLKDGDAFGDALVFESFLPVDQVAAEGFFRLTCGAVPSCEGQKNLLLIRRGWKEETRPYWQVVLVCPVHAQPELVAAVRRGE